MMATGLTLKNLEARYGELPDTLTSKTAGGGEHRLFRCAGRIRNSASEVGMEVDVRGEAGYIVIPPSVCEGKRYRWVKQQVMKPANLPTAWVAAVKQPAEQMDLAAVFSNEPIPKGKRNSTLTAMAFELRRRGKLRPDVLDELRAVNAKRCRPTEADSRLTSLVDRIFKNEVAPVAPPDIFALVPTLNGPGSTKSVASLDDLKLTPLVYALRQILPSGCGLMVGPPKIGKSLLGLQMALSVAAELPLWPGREPERGGDVLYIAYEDNDRRMKKRATQLMNGKPLPARLEVAYDWRRMDQGGIKDLEKWLEEHPAARLVIIDTMALFRPTNVRTRTAFDFDYGTTRLMSVIAERHQVAILMVHHSSKREAVDPLERVNGTNGLVAGADTIMMLSRERETDDGALLVTGRDVRKTYCWEMKKLPNGGWAAGKPLSDVQLSQARKAIIGALTELKPSLPNVIAKHLKKKDGTIRKLLMDMLQDGEVICRNGKYSLPSEKAAK